MNKFESSIPSEYKIDTCSPYVEHVMSHRGLFLQIPTGMSEQDSMSHRLLISAICSELIEKGFGGKIAVLDPSPEINQHIPIEANLPENLKDMIHDAIVRALPYMSKGIAQGQIDMLSVPSFGNISPYIQDNFMLGIHNDHPVLVTSTPAREDYESSMADYKTRMTRMGNYLNYPFGFIPYYCEWGNVIPTKQYVFIGRDARQKWRGIHELVNGVSVTKKQALKDMQNFFTSDGKRQLFLLDEENELDQEVYHLDMAAKVCMDSTGREVVLLSSLRKAKEILSLHGLLPKGTSPPSMGAWIEAQGYPQMDNSVSTKAKGAMLKSLQQSGHPAARFLKSRDMKSFTYLANEASKTMYSLYADTIHILQSMDSGLPHFFHKDNYEPVQKYLDIMGERLAGLGFPIIEIPALLLNTEYFGAHIHPEDTITRISLPPVKGLKVGGQIELSSQNLQPSSVPIYAPVNGMQCNIPGKPSVFITSGFLRLFDEVVAKEVKALGLQPIQLLRMASYGRELSGFHCIELPIPQ
jgi:hypothetical protein